MGERHPRVNTTLLFLTAAVLSSCVGSDTGPGRAPPDQGTPTASHNGTRVEHHSVVRVDPTSGLVQAVISVGPDPLLMDVASERVWTLNLGDGTLSLIDPATNRATSVSIGEAVGMTSDGEDLWVAVDGSSIARIDGATGEEQASIRLGARPLFALREAGFPAVGGGAIWLTVPKLGRERLPQELWRIDPASGRVVKKIGLGPNPLGPFSHGPYLWIITGPGGRMPKLRGHLIRIDMRSNQVTEVPVGTQPWGLAAGAGSLWVGHMSDRQVWRLDPETGEPTAKVPINDAAGGMVFGGGRVWVTTATGLISIDPAINEVSQTIELIERTPEEGPIDVAYVDGSIWVSVE
jgi:DNA-binding beta-propeller fold protein YncE